MPLPPKAKVSNESSQTRRRKTASTKAPMPVEDRIKKHFKSLCAQIDGGHFQNAVKTCDKILRLEPNDRDALQAKLYLLLQTERYNDALSLIEQSEGRHQFEKAYALYRLNQEDESSQILKNLKSSGPNNHKGVLHLEAQLYYRKEEYQEALDVYTELLNSLSSQSEEHRDTLVNLTAAQTHLDFLNSGYQKELHQLSIDELESNPPPPLPSTLTNLPSAIDVQPKEKEKKVRMRRVPKGVIPGVTPPPDPERWIKKSERTNIPTQKRKKGGGATQGSAVEKEIPSKSGNGPSKGKKKK